jgi:glycosyltransferase involved in cell wall biosynthesis
MISILIPTYNNVKYMDWCLKSLRENTSSPLQILVHGNCSGNELKEVCKKWDVDHYQSSSDNLGIAIPTNQLAKHAIHEFITYGNDDIYYGKNWNISLLGKVRSDIFYQYLTPVMFERQYNNPSMNAPNDFGDSPENFREAEFNNTWMEKRRIKEDIISCWGPPFMHRDLWFEIGGFNEQYYPGWGTDSDLVAEIYFRAKRGNKPYEFHGVCDSPLYHIQSVGLSKVKDGSSYQQAAIHIFQQRWGMGAMELYNEIGTGRSLNKRC